MSERVRTMERESKNITYFLPCFNFLILSRKTRGSRERSRPRESRGMRGRQAPAQDPERERENERERERARERERETIGA